MTSQETSPEYEGSLLWTLEEISHLVSHSGNAAETLANVVKLIQQRFKTDVCSVYLLQPDRSNLVLAATVGLLPQSVGRVRMRLNEGLVGLVGEQVEPLVLADATKHPRFKYFPEAGEDTYHSFLGVPLVDRRLLQGVLVVQTIEPRVFSQEDVGMLMTAGRQLAPIVSEARTMGQFVAPAHERLYALAQNLWWSWDDDSTRLFRALDPVPRPYRGRATQRCNRYRLTNLKSGRRNWRCTAASTTPIAECRSTCRRNTPGGRGMPVSFGPDRWPIFPLSSACTNQFRSIQAAWAYSQAITLRVPPIWASHSSALDSITRRVISSSVSILKVGSRRTTSASTVRCCQFIKFSVRLVNQ